MPTLDTHLHPDTDRRAKLDCERAIWDVEYRAQLKSELRALAELQGRRWAMHGPVDFSAVGDNIERFPIEKTARPKQR